MVAISEAEKEYLRDGIRLNYRVDGRTNDALRCIDVDLRSVPNCLGGVSYKVSNSHILVSINGQVVQTDTARIETNITMSPTASMDQSDVDHEEAYLTAEVQKTLCNIPELLKALNVYNDIFAWTLFVDVMILAHDGCILDHISNSIFVAFRNLWLPKIKPFKKIAKGTSQVTYDFEIDKMTSEPLPDDVLHHFPIISTIGDIKGLILWDMTASEELCTQSQYRLVINLNRICSFVRIGTVCNTVNIPDVTKVLTHSEGLGKEIISKLLQAQD